MRGIFTNKGADKLWKILKFLDAHPEKHDQTVWLHQGVGTVTELSNTVTWTCQTTGCLAGWAAVSSGWCPLIDDNELKSLTPGEDIAVEIVIDSKGIKKEIFEVAIRAFVGDKQTKMDDLINHSTGHRYYMDHWLYDKNATPTQKMWVLFDGGNTIGRLWHLAHIYSNGYIVRETDNG